MNPIRILRRLLRRSSISAAIREDLDRHALLSAELRVAQSATQVVTTDALPFTLRAPALIRAIYPPIWRQN